MGDGEAVSAARNLPVALPHPVRPHGPRRAAPWGPRAPHHPPLGAAVGGCTHGCSPCWGGLCQFLQAGLGMAGLGEVQMRKIGFLR